MSLVILQKGLEVKSGPATERCLSANKRFLQWTGDGVMIHTAAEADFIPEEFRVEANEKTAMTLGEKIRSARKSAGLTQEQLAKKLLVSRQAVTKWEADKGIPDVENLKQLSNLLDISMDYLLNDEEGLDLSVTKEKIDLNNYPYTRTIKGRWRQKTGKKDMAVMEKYPDAEIHRLVGKQICTRAEKITDYAIGFLTDAPFGILEFLNGLKNAGQEFYLVSQSGKQFLVTVTDEWMESRQLREEITTVKFKIGNFSFMDCGIISGPDKRSKNV